MKHIYTRCLMFVYKFVILLAGQRTIEKYIDEKLVTNILFDILLQLLWILNRRQAELSKWLRKREGNKKIISSFEKSVASRRTKTIQEESSQASGPSAMKENKNSKEVKFGPYFLLIKKPGQAPQKRANVQYERAAKKVKTSSFDQASVGYQITIIDRSDPDGKKSVERSHWWLTLLYATGGCPYLSK